MDNNQHIKFKIPDRSYSNIVKKEIHKIAVSIGFTLTRLAEIDIIASEIISNLNKHTPEGELLVKAFNDINEKTGIEILSIDNGPGIENLSEMLKDGKSTTSTLGQGLGSIIRFSDNFDVYSKSGWGTILLSRIYLSQTKEPKVKANLAVNSLMVPKNNESVCGDGWKLIRQSSFYKIIALDGLGHGPEAYKASKKAVDEFMEIIGATPAETIKILHRKIRGTRGAVGMVFHFDTISNSISFAGLGNVSAILLGTEKNKNCVSYNGIIGYSIPNTLNSNKIQWDINDTLIVSSDGLKSRWDLSHLSDILKHDGSLVAAALYKEFSRNTDDLLIVVVKYLKNENRGYKF